MSPPTAWRRWICCAAMAWPGYPRLAPADLLDLNMPKMGGLEFLRAIREDPVLRPLTVVGTHHIR